MKFEFTATSVVSYIEDDVCVVSFADSASAEPMKYLVLSQALFDTGDDDDQIGIEYGRDGAEVTGGAKSARLDSTSFGMEADPHIVGVSAFRIALGCSLDHEVREHLKEVFRKSSAKLTFC